MRRKEQEDIHLIRFIKAMVADKPANESAIVVAARDTTCAAKAARRTVHRVIKDYDGRHWHTDRGYMNNERRVFRCA